MKDLREQIAYGHVTAVTLLAKTSDEDFYESLLNLGGAGYKEVVYDNGEVLVLSNVYLGEFEDEDFLILADAADGPANDGEADGVTLSLASRDLEVYYEF